jgi:AI-2 transport protein TqsA
VPNPIEPPIRAELHVQTVCLSIISVVAVGFALWWLQPVMIPFVVAAFLAFALMPLVDGLEVHARLPRSIAVCVALLLALGVLGAAGALTRTAVIQVTDNAALYEKKLVGIADWFMNLAPVRWVVRTPEHTEEPVLNGSKSPPPNGATQTGIPESKPNPLSILPEGTVQTLLLAATNVIWIIFKQSIVVLIFLFFLLMSSRKRDRPIGGAWGEVEARIRAYILTMSTLCAVTGLLDGIVLAIIGVQAAVLFGVLTFLLNFIPNVGSFIATLLPLPIVILSDLPTPLKIMAIAIPAAIQIVIGNLIQPKMMGDSMKLHPLTILIALIFWGMLWGLVGAFLAVPITSMIRIACARHPLTRPVAALMAGRLDALREEPPVAAQQSAAL